MKKIGLIGGMSWASTVEYYRIINELTEQKLGGYHSAELILYSVDFHDIETYQHANQWDLAACILIDAAHALERAGVNMVLICGNTMHKVADEVEAAIQVPLVHIVDVTREAISRQGLRKVGLLGTKFTMEQDFFVDRLRRDGLEIVIPEETDREAVHRIIFEELCKGIISDESREKYKEIINKLEQQGAEGVILGCTEIGLLIKAGDSSLPLFDTTIIHARHAVERANE